MAGRVAPVERRADPRVADGTLDDLAKDTAEQGAGRAPTGPAATAEQFSQHAAGYLISVILDSYGSSNPMCSLKPVSSCAGAMGVAVPISCSN